MPLGELREMGRNREERAHEESEEMETVIQKMLVAKESKSDCKRRPLV